MLVIEERHQFEVATFRAESDYQDGRHPTQVTFASANTDALRRDFTVNGLFYDPLQARTYDWVGGQSDLRARVIRTIGSPEERFAEDHLRLLRAVRLAAQLGFEIEPATFAAVRSNAQKIRRVSAERVRDELIKLLRPPYAGRGLELLRQCGLLQETLPEISATVDCEQSPEYHPEGTVFQHLVRMLEQLPAGAPPALPWAVLLHDVGKPVTLSKPADGVIHFYGHERIGAEMAETILNRLRFPRRETETVVQCVRCHMQFKDVPRMRRATVRRMILRPTFELELALHRLDCLGSHGGLDIYEFLVNEARQLQNQPEMTPPLITGTDLIALGMRPGPAMGALLAQIRDKQLQEELKTPEEARAWASTQLKPEQN